MESESYSLKSIRYAYFLRHHRLIRPRVRSLDDFGRSLRQRSRVLYLLMTSSFFPRDGIQSSLLAISKSLSPWGHGTKSFCRTTKCSRYRLGELHDLLTNSFLFVFSIWWVTDLFSAIRFEGRPITLGNTDNYLGHCGIPKHTSTSSCSCSRWRKTNLDAYSELFNIKTSKIAFYPKSSYSFSVAFRRVSSASVLHVMRSSSSVLIHIFCIVLRSPDVFSVLRDRFFSAFRSLSIFFIVETAFHVEHDWHFSFLFFRSIRKNNISDVDHRQGRVMTEFDTNCFVIDLSRYILLSYAFVLWSSISELMYWSCTLSTLQ